MRELTPETITDAVLDQMATTPDPRLKTIMAAAVKHLHAFAREVNLTPAEWIKGIEFMTAAGKMCSPERQEFILLSDTLGLSALVNGLHDATALEQATNTSLLGPFYREATPTLAAGSSIAKNPKPESECVLYGRVTDVAGKPVAGATVSIWQTGADGLYVLRTVKPLGYSIPMDGPVGAMVKAQARHGMRPAHIHFLVGASGYRELVTALYLRDDPHLADDVVFGSSGDLAVDVVTSDPGCPIKGLPSIRFDVRLSRESEADKTSGRVGADPSAIMKQSAKNQPTPVGAK